MGRQDLWIYTIGDALRGHSYDTYSQTIEEPIEQADWAACKYGGNCRMSSLLYAARLEAGCYTSVGGFTPRTLCE